MRHSKAQILVRAFDERKQVKLDRVKRDVAKGARLVRKDSRGRVVSDRRIDAEKPRKVKSAKPKTRRKP